MAAFRDIEADIFLFGSQVDGSAGHFSDYDVGYDAAVPVPAPVLAAFHQELEDLPIPGRVDLVNFRGVSEDFARHA